MARAVSGPGALFTGTAKGRCLECPGGRENLAWKPAVVWAVALSHGLRLFRSRWVDKCKTISISVYHYRQLQLAFISPMHLVHAVCQIYSLEPFCMANWCKQNHLGWAIHMYSQNWRLKSVLNIDRCYVCGTVILMVTWSQLLPTYSQFCHPYPTPQTVFVLMTVEWTCTEPGEPAAGPYCSPPWRWEERAIALSGFVWWMRPSRETWLMHGGPRS